MDIIPLGDSALVVRVRDQFEDAPQETLDEVLRVFRLLQCAAIPGVMELAPAYTSVAVFLILSPFEVERRSERDARRARTKIRSAITRSRRHRRRTTQRYSAFDRKSRLS